MRRLDARLQRAMVRLSRCPYNPATQPSADGAGMRSDVRSFPQPRCFRAGGYPRATARAFQNDVLVPNSKGIPGERGRLVGSASRGST